MNASEIIERIKSLANPKNVAGMARFGINPANTYGVSIPVLRKMARETGRDHALALELWASGIHEARLLACFIDRPDMVTGEQMEGWVKDFDSWDICDQCCSNLFDRTPVAHEKAVAWCEREEEFVRRAGFVLMACLAVHDKEADDRAFIEFLPLMKKYATDERNFVKKAVNWALRQIGKRNINLNKAAIAAAEDIKQTDSKSARWIAGDAIRELSSDAVRDKLAAKK